MQISSQMHCPIRLVHPTSDNTQGSVEIGSEGGRKERRERGGEGKRRRWEGKREEEEGRGERKQLVKNVLYR